MSENNDFRHEEQGYNNPENLYHFNYNEQQNTPGDPGWAEAPAEEKTELEEAEPLAAGVPQALRVSTASRAAKPTAQTAAAPVLAGRYLKSLG